MFSSMAASCIMLHVSRCYSLARHVVAAYKMPRNKRSHLPPWRITHCDRTFTTVIAIGGVCSPYDVLYLGMSVGTRVPVHAGMLLLARTLFKHCHSMLKHDYHIHVVGHSLGGALGILLSDMLVRHGWSVQLVCTFGCPAFTLMHHQCDNIHNVLFDTDPIWFLPIVDRFTLPGYVHLYTANNGVVSGLSYSEARSMVREEEQCLENHQMTTYVTHAHEQCCRLFEEYTRL